MDGMKCPRCGATGNVIAPGFTKYDCLSLTGNGKFHQHARCQRIELDRLRAIVEPLERLLATKREVMICHAGSYVYVDVSGYGDYCDDTLAEALAKAAAELEGPE